MVEEKMININSNKVKNLCASKGRDMNFIEVFVLDTPKGTLSNYLDNSEMPESVVNKLSKYLEVDTNDLCADESNINHIPIIPEEIEIVKTKKTHNHNMTELTEKQIIELKTQMRLANYTSEQISVKLGRSKTYLYSCFYNKAINKDDLKKIKQLIKANNTIQPINNINNNKQTINIQKMIVQDENGNETVKILIDEAEYNKYLKVMKLLDEINKL